MYGEVSGSISISNAAGCSTVQEILDGGPCDRDGDGIPDNEDACPDSDLGNTVVVEGCDTYVDNELFENGCTISDLIMECAEGTDNHEKFVSCVAQLTNDLKKDGITGREKGAIQRCADQADIP
jgi:hypothetical protein